MSVPIPLPQIASARLPATYEAAKTAIAECARIDECKDWANKAQAMASYAKQANDESLLKMARRIQARAISRCGELMLQIKPVHGVRTDLEHREGGHPMLTRKTAAKKAGLSEHQQKTALRVANVPEDEREALIESDDPPTVSQLADIGKKTKTQLKHKPLVDLGDIDPEAYKRATEVRGTLLRFAEFCEKHEPTQIAQAFKPHEVARLRQCVGVIDAWLDRFITHLPE